MSAIISKTKYKDIDAVAFESSNFKAVFLPNYGAKLASFVCKQSGREFLVQAEGKTYKKLDYGGDYVEAECSGFDDMFPTIDEYKYDKHPWEGAVMPDHGEVCGLPWEYEILESNTCLHMFVYSVRFSYRLDKWVRLSGSSELVIEYEVRNLSPFDLDYIWAGHIMINAEEGADIILPYEDGSEATCVFCSDDNFALPGSRLVWPKTTAENGDIIDISKTAAKSDTGCTYKYYFDERMKGSRCGYRYADGQIFNLNVSTDTVPFLGIWINDGAFKGYYNLAFEPCTGAFDDPGRALEHGKNSVLEAGGDSHWVLSLSIS